MNKQLPWQIPIIIICLLLSIGFGLKVILMTHYTIEDELATYEVYTIVKRVDKLLQIAGVRVTEYDKLSHALSDRLTRGETVTIMRAKPITIQIGDTPQTIYTTNSRVPIILQEANIDLTELDIVKPGTKAVVNPGDTIYIDRVKKNKNEMVVQTIAPIIYKIVNKVQTGALELVSEGVAGQQLIRGNEYSENGRWYQTDITSVSVLQSAVSTIYHLGKENLFVAPSGTPYAIKSVHMMLASAYDLSYESCGKYPDHPLYGITRSGTMARPGVVAVDPTLISLGSKLYVESLDYYRDYGFSSAEDTGSAIKGNRIDLFIGDSKSAIRYGKRNVRVYVLDEKVEEHLLVGYGK
jgi:uncharacterized protein YabE (DUF348 family)/3D (Asp-Asp-Asp) domain-containing protein